MGEVGVVLGPGVEELAEDSAPVAAAVARALTQWAPTQLAATVGLADQG